MVQCFLEFKKNCTELVEETQRNADNKINDLLAEIDQLRNRLAAQMQENERLGKEKRDLQAELDKLRKMLKAMGKQKKMNVDDVLAKMKLKSNLYINSLNSKNEDYDKIVLDNYLFHIIKVGV